MGVYSSDWPWRRLFAAMGGFPVLLSCFREREEEDLQQSRRHRQFVQSCCLCKIFKGGDRKRMTFRVETS